MLITLGANPTHQDPLYQNTAIHWACLGKNKGVILLLVRLTKIPGSVQNFQKKTPFDIIMEDLAKIEHYNLPKSVITKIKQSDPNGERKDREEKSLLLKIRNNSKTRFYSNVTLPLIIFFFSGLIFQSSLHYAAKILLLCCINFYVNNVTKYLYDVEGMKLLPMMIYLTTKMMFYFTWLVFILPHVSVMETVVFLGLSSGLWYHFLKSWLGDPGVIKVSREQKMKTIIELAEKEDFVPKVFCRTCLIRRPVRSKHCAICDR